MFVLAVGDKGEDVTALQNALVGKGYFVGAVDGVYGSRTEAAVRYFQSCSGITIDGAAGPQTLDLLGVGIQASPATVTMHIVRAHVDNMKDWFVPIEASKPIDVTVVGLFSAGSVQASSEWSGHVALHDMVFLEIPEGIRGQAEEVHVHVTAYGPDTVIVDEQTGSFFVTK